MRRVEVRQGVEGWNQCRARQKGEGMSKRSGSSQSKSKRGRTPADAPEVAGRCSGHLFTLLGQ